MLSIYLYQSFPSGMSLDISLSVRTHLNIPHKNSTFFSVSLYFLIFFFFFSSNTLSKQKLQWTKIILAKMNVFKAITLGEKPELRLNSTPLKQRMGCLLNTRGGIQSWPSVLANWPDPQEK